MTDPDRELAGKAREGDRRALMALYDRYRGRILGMLIKQMGRRELAEDVFQEVWIKVMNGIGSYRPGPTTFRAWLFRVAANAAVDRRRRESKHDALELDAPVDESGETRTERLPETGPDAFRQTLGHELGERLSRALEQLSPRQRAAVLLRHQQGLSYGEISGALGLPEGTAKTLVHRGVAILRRHLGTLGEDFGDPS